MNCDQIFDVLTRGPFPSGDPSDAAVDRHLTCCHDCRALAEALRPAVGLFHEALDEDELLQLPQYRGALPRAKRGEPLVVGRAAPSAPAPWDIDVSAAIAARPTRKARVRLRKPSSTWRWRQAYRFAAGLALGAALYAMLWAGSGGEFLVSTNDGGEVAPVGTAAPPNFADPNGAKSNNDSLARFDFSTLPAACLNDKNQLASANQIENIVCCTKCHFVGGRLALAPGAEDHISKDNASKDPVSKGNAKPRAVAAARLVLACGECHQADTSRQHPVSRRGDDLLLLAAARG